MTPRTRRTIGGMGVIVAILLLARWSVGFVAERWWAATISPDATAFVTNWQLLGLALDAGAIVIASLWFVVQALLVARAIASVQVAHRLGNLQLREAVPTRLLLGGAVASGILLGLIAGAGAHSWRERILLAWQGVRFGSTEPLLHLDIGIIVGQLPGWDLLHHFAALLALLGLAFCLALYAGIGALRRENGLLSVHPDARRHLGVLLALVALVVAAGYLLAPYHLAAAALQSLAPDGAQTRVRAAQVLAGIALATAMLSLNWALRGRNSLLAAAWIVLAAGALGERYVVPALIDSAPPAAGRQQLARRFDAMAWGIREADASVESTPIPVVTAIWDERLLSRLVEQGGGPLYAATPGMLPRSDGPGVPVWLVATPAAAGSDAIDVLAVEDGVVSGGAPVMIRSPEFARSVRPVWRTVVEPRTRPAAPSWQNVASGVNASTPARRLLLAWARQAPGMLRAQRLNDVDWHLDPASRAAAVLPMFSWLPPDLVLIGGRPSWVVQGMLAIDQFPLATRGHWHDARVAGVVPAVLCSEDVASGETRFYLDPAADSTAAAWAHLIGGLIAPSATIPAELRTHLTYPVEWLDAQLEVMRSPTWSTGRGAVLTSPPAAPAPVWVSDRVPGHQAVVTESGTGFVAMTMTAYRLGATPQLRIERRDSTASPGEMRFELGQRWNRAEELLHLRDSVTAAGDTVWAGAARWFAGRELGAWQPVFAVPVRGSPALLWVATSLGDRLGGGRNPAEAWRATTDADRAANASGPTDAAILDASRLWLRAADSAMHRGDMTAFGRAFEELRRALAKRP